MRLRPGVLIAIVWTAAIGYVVGFSLLVKQPVGGGAGGLTLQVVTLLLWAGFTPAILALTRRVPLERRRWWLVLLVHLGAAALVILALNVGGQWLTTLITERSLRLADGWRQGLIAFAQQFHLAFVVYALIAATGYYRIAAEARRHEELAAERLRADLAEARLLALRLKIQPHFLFNALNAIGTLILTKQNAQAFEAIGQLGDLFRAVLATEHRQEVSLHEERALAEAYLAIERVRLGERLVTSWEMAPEAAGAMVPPLLLQPLVENAVRHGVAPRASGGQVKVRVSRIADRLRLEVWDDGSGSSQVEGNGIGLENTRRRLAHQYGADQRLELDRIDDWTRVLVEIPFRLATA